MAMSDHICPDCGKDTRDSEGWSTGQCDDCYLEDLASTESNQIWDILVEECGAAESLRSHFSSQYEPYESMEYRFCGALGFGGKVRYGNGTYHLYVTYYHEDKTEERDQMVKRANERLQAL